MFNFKWVMLPTELSAEILVDPEIPYVPRQETIQGSWYTLNFPPGKRVVWDGRYLLEPFGSIDDLQWKVCMAPGWFVKNFPKLPLDGVLCNYNSDWTKIKFVVCDIALDRTPFTARYEQMKKLNLEIATVEYHETVDCNSLQPGTILLRGDSFYQPRKVETMLVFKPIYVGVAEIVGYREGLFTLQWQLGGYKCIKDRRIFYCEKQIPAAIRKGYRFERGRCVSVANDLPTIGDKVIYGTFRFLKKKPEGSWYIGTIKREQQSRPPPLQ